RRGPSRAPGTRSRTGSPGTATTGPDRPPTTRRNGWTAGYHPPMSLVGAFNAQVAKSRAGVNMRGAATAASSEPRLPNLGSATHDQFGIPRYGRPDGPY